MQIKITDKKKLTEMKEINLKAGIFYLDFFNGLLNLIGVV